MDTIGDIVVYTTSDRKSRFYDVRQDILGGAVNRLVHQVGEGQVPGFDPGGNSTVVPKLSLVQLFGGFVTFGSPLDKIAFFLREQVPADQYLRKQLVAHYHSFKQWDWNPKWKPAFTVRTPFRHLLDSVFWRNYYDCRDYVSGSLDFYEGLTNVDARLPKKLFTHNDYWSHRPMYADLVSRFLR